jgi:hypothetical protein
MINHPHAFFPCRASNEALRIRKDVAKKIVEIDAVVQVGAPTN